MRSARLVPLVAVLSLSLASGCVGSSSSNAEIDIADDTATTEPAAASDDTTAAADETDGAPVTVGSDENADSDAGSDAADTSATTGSTGGDGSPEGSGDGDDVTGTSGDATTGEPTSATVVDSSVTSGSVDIEVFEGFDPFEGLFDPENVDDSDYCRAYADFFSAYLPLLLAVGFDELGDSPAEGEDSIEVAEVALAPSLVEPVRIMIEDGPPEAATVLDPVAERVDAGVTALRDAGFDDDEIDALAAGDGVPESSDDVDPRLVEAAALLVERSGPFATFGEETDDSVDPAVEEANDRALAAACPKLDAALSGS